MKKSENPLSPYKTLGNKIRRLRLNSKAKISDLSSAIEIDEKTLKKIESGSIRPDEDILDLIISYLNIEDKDADRLWELAGYDENEDKEIASEENLIQKSLVMLFNSSPSNDQKTLYSDSLDVHYNNTGVVFSFKQAVGQNKSSDVARIGMSWEQAREVNKTLQKVFIARQINPDKSSNKDSKN